MDPQSGATTTPKINGAMMVVVTHEMGFAREVGSKVVVMDDGAVIETGAPADVLSARSTSARVRSLKVL